jgi:hypothetical protein
MRKIMLGMLAVALTVMPLSGSFAHEGWRYYPPKQPPKPPHQTQTVNHAGQWAVGCGIASAASLMVGSVIAGSHKNEKLRRQLTVTEAYWYASACPFLLPLALVAQATCPDNKATYKVATLAYLYLNKHPSADQSAFTSAYGEACRTGKLSRETKDKLWSLVRA